MSADAAVEAVGTFMGIPASRDLSASKAAVLGIPFDCGFHPTRIGSRLGPNSIREHSGLVRRYEPPLRDSDPVARLNLVDYGNVRLRSGYVAEAFENIEAAVAEIVGAGAVPVTMGGDGAVTLPQLRALHRRHPDLVVLHIDAHTDTYPDDGESRFTNATTFTRAAEEAVVDPRNSIHLGARGAVASPGLFEYTRNWGYELIPGIELDNLGIPAVLAHICKRLVGRPVYLCFDMDVFDPSVAPGVCTPSWGGLSAKEGLAILDGLAELDFVAFDVNTVSPPHDSAGMTAFLAGTVMHKCLQLACAGLERGRSKPRADQPVPTA
ncbi:MAG TPA: arginase family protein [Stellaceae bacterium]|nr:arginase family protein [Stellaceae bacterium]